jgi:hypothetical protein
MVDSSRLYLFVMHKASSVLQHNISLYVNKLDSRERIVFNRWKESTYKDFNIRDNNCLIIIRHPLNKLISQYYSYGWTHPPQIAGAKHKERSALIRSMTLDEYVTEQSNKSNIINSFLEAYKYKDKLLKYEDMMRDPNSYMLFLLKQINRREFSQSLVAKFKDQFLFKHGDLSEDIVKRGLITHKRNLDHEEYKHKLLPSTINNINNNLKEIIDTYNSLQKIYSF